MYTYTMHTHTHTYSCIHTLYIHMPSRFVIAFFPSSKCLLISWPQSPSAVILKPKKILSLFLLFLFAMK